MNCTSKTTTPTVTNTGRGQIAKTVMAMTAKNKRTKTRIITKLASVKIREPIGFTCFSRIV
jgi:type III secretion system FlhB-like substrate exporter